MADSLRVGHHLLTPPTTPLLLPLLSLYLPPKKPPPPPPPHLPPRAMDGAIVALLAAAAASVAGVLSCLLIAFLCRRRRGEGLGKPRRRGCCLAASSSSAPALPVSASARAGMSSWSWSLHGAAAADCALPRLSLADLAAATGGFSPDNIIGDGSFGFVYRAVLPGGDAVAVKRLSADHAAGNREFVAELEVLGGLSHPNLARLLGYCAAGRDRILVYELLERGCLDSWLHGGDGAAAADTLPWPARLRVARGAAAALAFLHHGRTPTVLHRDIKASNVLLGDGFEAKLADFGLARIVGGSPTASHVSTQAAGTAGYMAPEIWAGMGATAKADVYSFGVLIIEMVTAHRPNLPVKDELSGNKEIDLVGWARKKIDAGLAMEILDPRMAIGKEGKEMEEVKGLLDIAQQCTETSHRNRPTMQEVVAMLNKL
ncbi:hypothetical protein ACP4OV_014604 [Aristida adscensionis]